MSPFITDAAELATGAEKKPVVESTSSKKPHLVFGATPVSGHTYPLVRVVEDLVQRGFEVTFIAGDEFEPAITSIGAKHVTVAGLFNNAKLVAERSVFPPGMPRLLWDIRNIFTGQTPDRWRIIKEVLEEIRAKDPEREVVLMPETFFMGVNPLSLGAPLPRGYTTRPKVINLHPIPYIGSSIDTAPFGPGLPPDSTESGRMRNQLMEQAMVQGPFAEVIAHQAEVLKELGATEVLEPHVPFHTWFNIHDMTLQMCPPSLEYPRSDMPSNIKFAGCAPPKPIPTDFVYPSWWEDVERGDRRIVAVTQGTISHEATDLIIPTIQALADRDDLLVVVILGKKDAVLPENVVIPSNTRVIDYFSYDVLLSHASVFVMNAGYGGFLHGITNGVPLVLAGATEDKPEVAMRGEWSGVAVNLRTGQPTPEMVKAGVECILSDDSFKKRVEEIKAENEAMKMFDFIERQILSIGDLDA